MSQEVLLLQKPIPADLEEELLKKSVYCSPHLKRLEILDGGRSVRIHVDNREQTAAVTDKVERFIGSMMKGHRRFPRKTTFQNDFHPAFCEDVWAEAQRRRWVFDSGFGQVTLAGPALGLFHYMESVFCDLAYRLFDAREYRFPTLIPAEVLGRVGYFRSFPQAITFASHLEGDLDSIEEFSAANQDPPLRFPNPEVLRAPSYCLTPVVCYHCYRTLERQHLDVNEVRSFTAVGSCFRYESNNTTSLERLWDFTLREIIFVGARDEISNYRQRCMDAVAEWLNRLELRACFETASDPFFTSDFSEKTYFQMLADLKFEMRVHVAPDRTIAAGSFNLHNDFFGKTFEIQSGDNVAFSGCVGFGVERFVYAFLCQKGFDLATWPDEVRAFIEGRRQWLS